MGDTFGHVLREARKNRGLSQNDVAAKIMSKEDRVSISPQYLNDIEHDRRNAPPHIVKQLAEVLGLNEDSALVAAGSVPDYLRKAALRDPDEVADTFRAFRRGRGGK